MSCLTDGIAEYQTYPHKCRSNQDRYRRDGLYRRFCDTCCNTMYIRGGYCTCCNRSINYQARYKSNCMICQKTQTVILHHVLYFPERVIPVCAKCHSAIHHGKHPKLEPPQGHATAFYNTYEPKPDPSYELSENHIAFHFCKDIHHKHYLTSTQRSRRRGYSLITLRKWHLSFSIHSGTQKTFDIS